jgi:hypothetical protein
MAKHICGRCGLSAAPFRDHKRVIDCFAASRALAENLQKFLAGVTPFISCWELDSFDLTTDGEEIFKELANTVGYTKEENAVP